jgi:hypothetical protein
MSEKDFTSQTRPDEWDGQRIVDWFTSNRLYRDSLVSHDGYEFCRVDGTYGYIWISSSVDLDYEAAWLVDVRTHDGQSESRRHMAILSTQRQGWAWEWSPHTGNGTGRQFDLDLLWFPEVVIRHLSPNADAVLEEA